jgi:hypothetical protein
LDLLELFAMPKVQDTEYIAYTLFQHTEFLLDEHDRGVNFFDACEVQWYGLPNSYHITSDNLFLEPFESCF